MKEAEKASLKESERIEKEIAEMKEMKVMFPFSKHGTCCFRIHANILFLHTEKDQHDDSRWVLCEAPWTQTEVWRWDPQWLLGILRRSMCSVSPLFGISNKTSLFPLNGQGSWPSKLDETWCVKVPTNSSVFVSWSGLIILRFLSVCPIKFLFLLLGSCNKYENLSRSWLMPYNLWFVGILILRGQAPETCLSHLIQEFSLL